MNFNFTSLRVICRMAIMPIATMIFFCGNLLGQDQTTPSVTISGTLKYGQTLTATVTGFAAGASLTYQWSRTKESTTTPIGTDSHQYTLGTEDIGATIKVTVSDGTLTAEDETAEIIAKADQPALIFGCGPSIEITYGSTGTCVAPAKNFDVLPPVEFGISDATVVRYDPVTGIITPLKAGSATIKATALGGDNYNDVSATLNVTVTKRAVTITADAKSITYGDSDPALTYTTSFDPTTLGDAFTGALSLANVQRSTSNHLKVGTYPIEQGTLAISNGDNYEITFAGNNLTVSALALIQNVVPQNKTYDGNATASYTGGLTNVVSGDNVILNASLSFTAGKDVQTDGTVKADIWSITGNDAANYSLPSFPTTAKATISPASTSINVLIKNKTYDGTNTATVDGTPSLTINYDGENLGITQGTAVFSSINAGEKPIQITFAGWALTGNAAHNYTLNGQPTATAMINKAEQSGFDFSQSLQTITYGDTDKKFEANGDQSDGAVTYSVTSGNDVINVDPASGLISTVKNGSAVVTATKAGNTNYEAATATLNVIVAQKQLTATAVATRRDYAPGNKNVDVTLSLEGIVGSDNVTATATGTMNDADAGTKEVAIANITLDGKDKNKYIAPSIASTTVTINKIELSDFAFAQSPSQSIVYGSSQTFTASSSQSTGAVTYSVQTGAEYVTVGGETGLVTAIKVGQATIIASHAGDKNYNSKTATLDVIVTPKEATVIWGETSFIYNGESQAPTAKIAGVNGDGEIPLVVTVQGEHKNAGEYSATAALPEVSIDARAGNYTLATSGQSTDYIIAKLGVDLSWSNTDGFVYNGQVQKPVASFVGVGNSTFNMEVTTSPNPSIDAGNYQATASFSDDLNLNYKLNSPETPAKSFTIAKKELTITGLSAGTKEYDGTTSATPQGVGTLSGVVTGDDVGISSGTAAFESAKAGTHTVKFSDYGLTGTKTGNYSLKQPADVQSTISKKELIVTPNNIEKKYSEPTPTMGLTYEGFIFGENENNASGFTVPTAIDPDPENNMPARTEPYKIECNSGSADNYDFTYKEGRLTIKKADYSGITYPSNIAPITYTAENTLESVKLASGYSWQNKDTKLTVSQSSYPAVYNAYPINYNDYVLNIPVTVVKGNQMKPIINNISDFKFTYSDDEAESVYGFTATTTSNCRGALTWRSSNTNVATIDNSGKLTIIGAGVATIYVQKAGDSNWNQSEESSVEITVAVATVKAPTIITPSGNALSLTYGDSYTVRAEKNTNTESKGALKYTSDDANVATIDESTGVLTLVGSGTTNIHVQQLADGNHTASSVAEFTLTVGKAPLHVSVSNESRNYGDANPAFTVDYNSGDWKYSDNASVLTKAPVASTTAVENSSVGQYPITLSVVESSKYNLDYTNALLTINPRPIDVVWTGTERTYNGEPQKPTATLTGVAGDPVYTLDVTGEQTDVNAYTATAALSPANPNYSLNNPTQSFNIKPLERAVEWSSLELEYNGSQQAPLPSIVFVGKDNGVQPTITVSGQQRDAGNDYPASATVNSANYTLTGATVKFNINPKEVTIGAVSEAVKVYDGTTVAKITGVTYPSANFDGTDDLSVALGTAHFDSKNVGTQRVTFSGFGLDGSAKNNYRLASQPAPVSATITPKQVTIVVTADDKVYDGNTAATVNSATINGKIEGDKLSVSNGTSTFSDKRAGGRTVTFSNFTLGGDDAGNYSLSAQPTAVSATINAKSLKINGLAVENKVYDGNTDATVNTSGAHLDGVVGADDVDFGIGTVRFADKKVGTDKSVSLTGFILTGADKDNYSLSPLASVSASITAKTVQATGISASGKTYDGNNNAVFVGTPVVAGLIDNDAVTVKAGVARFSNASVGDNKTVTFSDFTISGADAGNYSLAQPQSQTASITPLAVKIKMAVNDKTYDGGTSTSWKGDPEIVGKIAGDDLSAEMGFAVFESADVGRQRVRFYNFNKLTGSAKGNYSLPELPADTFATITPKSVNITGLTTSDKVYDATPNATLTGAATLDGIIGTDDVELMTGNAAFTDKNVGNDKAISLSDYTLTGAKATNYSLTVPTTLTASITPARATAEATASDKVYDGTAAAVIKNASVNGIISGDNVTLNNGTATFDMPTAGTDKTVTFSGFSLNGADAGNYELSQPAPAKATINRATPTFEMPTGLMAAVGQTLGSVTLPDGFVWDLSPTTSVGDIGINTFSVTYTPEDIVNYHPVTNIALTITVTSILVDFDNYAVIKWNNTILLNYSMLQDSGYVVNDEKECRWFENDKQVGSGFVWSKGPSRTDVLVTGNSYRFEVLTDKGLVSSTYKIFKVKESEGTTMSVYPNPVRSGEPVRITVKGEPTNDSRLLEVYTVTGRLVKRETVGAADLSEPPTIELNLNVPAGMYIIRWNGVESKLMIQ